MSSFYNVTPKSTYDGMQRALDDFQFDFENALMISQLTWKPTEERSAATLMIGKTAAEVAETSVTDQARLSELKGVVRSVGTKHGGGERECFT